MRNRVTSACLLSCLSQAATHIQCHSTIKSSLLVALKDAPYHRIHSQPQQIDSGIHRAVGQMQSVCKCHGVSSSCTTKTCWKRLKPFKETGDTLKANYYKAQLKVSNNRASRQRSSRNQMSRGTLSYTQSSPDFCPATRGRRCLDPNNCGILCCSRGYISRSVEETERCDCHWVSKHYKLSCRKCTFVKEIYACK